MGLFDGGLGRAFSDIASSVYLPGVLVVDRKRRRADGQQEIVGTDRVPIRYQRNVRTFQGPDGVIRREDRFLILQAPLEREASKLAIPVPIQETDDLDAIIIDNRGAMFDALSVKSDDGGAYWSVGFRLLTPAEVLAAILDENGASWVDEDGLILVA